MILSVLLTCGPTARADTPLSLSAPLGGRADPASQPGSRPLCRRSIDRSPAARGVSNPPSTKSR